MSQLFKRIDTVFLQVKEFDRAVEWYHSVLGFNVRWKDDQNGYAALNIGETPLTLVRATNETKYTHIPFNFYTAEIEKVHKYLVDLGVKVTSINEDSNVKWFDLEDLEGNQLGVCSFPE